MDDRISRKLSELMESRRGIDVQTAELHEQAIMKEEADKLQARDAALCEEITNIRSKLDEPGITNVFRKQMELEIAKLEEERNDLEVKHKEIQKKIDAFRETADKKKNLDKMTVFHNIRTLTKRKDIKLGDIERGAGCQAGYMSRLEKRDNSTDPSAEFIVTAAKMLGVSVDLLLCASLDELTPTEIYIIHFLQKLVRDTENDKLDWNKQSADYLNNIGSDIDGNTEHPLFSFEELFEEGETEKPDKVQRVIFTSHTFDVNTSIKGDCFNLRMKNGSMLYLMDISSNNDISACAREIWMYQPQREPSFLCSDRSNDMIGKLIDELYNAVSENIKHPRVQNDLKYVIDAFMADDLEDDPVDADDWPF